MVARLSDSLGTERFQQILKLNRIDLGHVRKGDSLIVPVGPGGGGTSPPDSLAGSPFPRLLAAITDPKLLLVSIRVQAFGAYEDGRLVRWGPTSTGRKEMPTPVGLYHVNWKDKERTSTFNEEWELRWCVNIDNSLGTSLHEYALPGRPASHSCVRLLAADAEWFYEWADQWQLTADGREIRENGTPVVIFGEYAYGARPPWKRLPEDPGAATLLPDEIASALEDYMGPLADPAIAAEGSPSR
jgi:hypothetical protein